MSNNPTNYIETVELLNETTREYNASLTREKILERKLQQANKRLMRATNALNQVAENTKDVENWKIAREALRQISEVKD